MRIRQLITSKKLVLGIFLFLAFCCLAANIIPQHSDAPAQGAGWVERFAPAGKLIAWIGLDHIFSTPWFVCLTIVFLISLAVSTLDQYRIALRKTWGVSQDQGTGGYPLSVPLEDFQNKIREWGYLAMGGGAHPARFVKHPWGFWGNFLLHFGLACAVLFALVYVVTEHRVIARLIEGEQVVLTPETIIERKGLLARDVALPSAMRLEQLEPGFWDNDQLRALASRSVTTTPSGETKLLELAINEKAAYGGMTVYQKNSFGTAFFLSFEDSRRPPFQETLFLPMPPRRDKAGYGTVLLADTGLTLKAKYFADASKQGIYPVNPQLVLRLYDGERMLGEATLQTGNSAILGNYVVHLTKTAWWTDYLFEGSRGTYGIFTGFAFILTGVVLSYFAIPRIVLVRQTDNGSRVTWQTARFAEFHAVEKDRIFAACRGEST